MERSKRKRLTLKVKIRWARGNETISFTRPSTWFCLGLRGTAKSSFLEHLAMRYMEKDAVVFDMFASRDGENLAWLRSPYAKDKKILLLRGENVDVQSSFPVKAVESLTLNDVENFDIIISASPLHLNPDQEFYNAARLTDLLYKRLHYKRLVYLTVREAANFYYSRLKVSDNQVAAKANMIYMIREARHVGLALGLDSIRYYAIDIDIRNLADFTVLKSQGVQGLASDLQWLYSFFDPSVIRNMPKQNFIIISKTGALGLGQFPYHEWHKEEREDILANVGVKVEYGEAVEEGELKGTFKTVGDKEHAEIVSSYALGSGMEKIAKDKGRSTRTISVHVNSHNSAIQRAGFCPQCKRVNSKHFCETVQRGKESIDKS
jgi:hypothetical protein